MEGCYVSSYSHLGMFLKNNIPTVKKNPQICITKCCILKLFITYLAFFNDPIGFEKPFSRIKSPYDY